MTFDSLIPSSKNECNFALNLSCVASRLLPWQGRRKVWKSGGRVVMRGHNLLSLVEILVNWSFKMWGCCAPGTPDSDRPAWRRAEEQELSSNNNNIRENSETAKPVINAPCDVWKWRRQCPPMFKTNQLSKSGIDYLFYINMTRVLKFLPLGTNLANTV